MTSSLLSGQIASAIYSGFKGKLLKATLRRAGPALSGGLDIRGDPIATDPETWDCQGFTDGYSDYLKANGIPQTDVRVQIFAKSLPAGVKPLKDDKVEIPKGSGTWFQLRRADTDPATALWSCQAFSVKAPT